MMNLKVSVTTRQNGYSLAIDKEEFMYYTPESLLAGFAIRLGLERLNAMTAREIGNLMNAATQGSLPKQLQKEVDCLNAQVKDQKKLIAQLRREIREIKQKYGEDEEYLRYRN
jgi:hypothetical protein